MSYRDFEATDLQEWVSLFNYLREVRTTADVERQYGKNALPYLAARDYINTVRPSSWILSEQGLAVLLRVRRIARRTTAQESQR